MDIPQIRIESTPGKIEINKRSGQLSIEQPQGELQIEQPQATMNITRIPGKLTIDQTRAREDVDLKSVKKRNEEFAQIGKQTLLNGIARRIQEGEQLMKIENGFQAISSIAKQNTEGKVKRFGLGFIPRAGSVDISYVPGAVKVEFTEHKPKINYKVNKPIIDFQSGEILIDMNPYPSLKIDLKSE
jgi:hypothetical protein